MTRAHSLLRRFSSFIRDIKYEDLPKNVVKQVKLSTIDTLGAILGATNEPTSKIIITLLKELGGIGQSTILAYGDKVPMINAALANGTMGCVLEMDDIAIGGHAGVVTVPAALAVGENLGTNGRDFIIGVALGYEAIRRVCFIYREEAYNRGICGSALSGPFAATATAGKILGLNQDELTNAFGMCALTSLSPFEPISAGGMTKNIMMGGWPSHIGVLNVSLAQRGFTAAETLLEGKSGIFRVMSGKHPLPIEKEELFMKDLSIDWAVEYVTRKIYPSCGCTFAPIEIALELRKMGVEIGDIEKIIITMQTQAYFVSGKDITDAVSARFSAPFLFILALKEGTLTPELIKKHLEDPEILELLEKIEVKVDKNLDRFFEDSFQSKGHWPAIVEMQTKDGRTLRKRIDISKGHHKNPLTENELTDKFRGLASNVLDADQIKTVIQTVNHLDELENISQLTQLLVSKQ